MAVGSVVTPADALSQVFTAVATQAGLTKRQKIISAAESTAPVTAPAAGAPPASPVPVALAPKLGGVLLVVALVVGAFFIFRKR